MAEEEQRSWDMLSEDRKKEVKVNRQPTPRSRDTFSALSSAFSHFGTSEKKICRSLNDDGGVGRTKQSGLPG